MLAWRRGGFVTAIDAVAGKPYHWRAHRYNRKNRNPHRI